MRAGDCGASRDDEYDAVGPWRLVVVVIPDNCGPCGQKINEDFRDQNIGYQSIGYRHQSWRKESSVLPETGCIVA